MYGIPEGELQVTIFLLVQVQKVSETSETKLNILDYKIDAEVADLLAIIQVILKMLHKFQCWRL